MESNPDDPSLGQRLTLALGGYFLEPVIHAGRAAEFGVDEAQELLLVSLPQRYPSRMSTMVEVEKLALDLSEKERAVLAANLLESLPGILSDDNEGVAEALRRVAEVDANPDEAISLAQLDSQIQSRRD